MKLKKTQELLKKSLRLRILILMPFVSARTGIKPLFFPPMPTVTHILI